MVRGPPRCLSPPSGTRPPPRQHPRMPRPRSAPPIARVLASGDELTLGKTVDTNSTFIAEHLHPCGLRVARLTVVGDVQAEVEAALRSSCDGAALVVMTGGLGPTDDDRTRHALAEV